MSSTKPVNAEDRAPSSDINKYKGEIQNIFLCWAINTPLQIFKGNRERLWYSEEKGFLEGFFFGGGTEKFVRCVSIEPIVHWTKFPLFGKRNDISPSWTASRHGDWWALIKSFLNYWMYILTKFSEEEKNVTNFYKESWKFLKLNIYSNFYQSSKWRA